MFRLILIISIFVLSSCSHTTKTKEDSEESLSLSHSYTNQPAMHESIILILEFGDENPQIIQYSDTLLTYGVGYVKPTDVISENDITWNLDYPLKKKNLNTSQQIVLNTAISKLASTYYVDSNVAKDDVEYILYINNCKVASGYSVFIESFPEMVRDIINNLLTIASPLYYKDSKS